MFDWNDLKFFLAVARDGSTLAASRRLKVSQATVSRRVTLLEEVLGVELFARHASGYVLTARGEALVRLMPPIPELTTPCWLVTTDQARRQPHVRAVIDTVTMHIEQVSALPGPNQEGEAFAS